ncbi:MAG: LURP-one-related/scramblase family protein [Gemmatimonadaceae bacterium]
MDYVLRQRLVSLGNNFTIKDMEGRDAFQVKGALATLGDKLSLEDAEGNELLYIEQKVFNWLGTYEISRDGRVVAQVRRNLKAFLRRRFTVEMSDAPDLEMTGDILAFEYVVTRGGFKVATFTRQWLRFSDTYWIRIEHDESDAVLILALAVIVEVIANRRHNY